MTVQTGFFKKGHYYVSTINDLCVSSWSARNFFRGVFSSACCRSGDNLHRPSRGTEEGIVKEYLTVYAEKLLDEIKEYQQIFDPRLYDEKPKKQQTPISLDEAKERIAKYKSPFYGWSNYVVDGVYWSKKEKQEEKMIEEATQVIRIMFLLNSSFNEKAQIAGCQDVLRAMIFQTITKQVLINQKTFWDKAEQQRFIKKYEPLAKEKLDFVKQYFVPVVQEVNKWMDDCWLFMFGYLVRQFSDKLLSVGYPEEEIWVANFYNLTVNIMKEVKKK